MAARDRNAPYNVTESSHRSDTSQLIMSGGPQIHDALSTSKLHLYLIVAAVPAAVWGFVQFGIPALTVVATGVAAAVLTEAILPGRRGSPADGNCVAIGLIMSLMFPPEAPWYLVAVSAVFAVGVVKWAFGGLGHAVLNPAIAGRVLAQVLHPEAMTRYTLPAGLGGGEFEGGASAVAALRAEATGQEPLQRLTELGYPRSGLDEAITEWLNAYLLTPVGIRLPGGYVDPFIGLAPGGVGEVSAVLLLIVSAVLIGRRVIAWQIPLSVFFGFTATIAIWGAVPHGGPVFGGDVLFHTLHGGVLFLMFFCATDNTSAPVTGAGMLLYGLLGGSLAAILQLFGLYPDQAAAALLIVTFFVPLIDYATKPTRFGFSRRTGQPLLYKARS